MADKDEAKDTDISPKQDGSQKAFTAAQKQITEAFEKEWQGKFKTQYGVVTDAKKLLQNETAKLKSMVDDYEKARADHKLLFKDL